MELLEHYNLRQLNTFHIPVVTRYFVDARCLRDMKEAVAFAQAKKLPFMLIGQGSNLLFREDYPGLIIELNIKGRELLEETEDSVLVQAACGEIWHHFVLYCLEQGWYGLENLSLIPGTVGAAPVQNIGAYGVELADVLLRLEALSIDSGEIHTFSNVDCNFGYRNSIFKQELAGKFIITSVTLRLSKEPKVNLSYGTLAKALEDVTTEEITPELVSSTVCKIRSSKLPDPSSLGNAGSFFWNPVVEQSRFQELKSSFPDIVGYPDGGNIKIPAAWLIEQAGWKGFREGDVGVHQEHALVLVNYGEANGEELFQLANKIQSSVDEKFGIKLRPEVRIIG